MMNVLLWVWEYHSEVFTYNNNRTMSIHHRQSEVLLGCNDIKIQKTFLNVFDVYIAKPSE